MAAKRCLLLLAALVSACAAMQISTGAVPVEGEEERRLTTPVQDEESRLLGSRRHAANASMGKTMAVKGHTVSKASPRATLFFVFFGLRAGSSRPRLDAARKTLPLGGAPGRQISIRNRNISGWILGRVWGPILSAL